MTDSPLATELILANSAHVGGAQTDVDRWVVHLTVSPTVRGGARNNARYFQGTSAGGSAHYVTDPEETVQCVPENRQAHHAPPNSRSLGGELCDPVVDRQTGQLLPMERWDDQPHQQMLAKFVALTKDVCIRHGLPFVWLEPADLLAGAKGITSHYNVSLAWHRTDHTDGSRDNFPVDHFMALVAGAPSPSTPIQQEDQEMFMAEFLDFPGKVWLVEVSARQGAQFGKRLYIPTPDHFYQLANHGVRVLSGKQPGGNMYQEVK